MVADHADGVDPLLNPGHHAEVAGLALDHLRAWIEQVCQQIAKAAMGVIDQHRAGPGVKGAGDGGIGLVGHQAAGTLVFGVAGAGLLGVEDARHTFDVSGDQDFHGLKRG